MRAAIKSVACEPPRAVGRRSLLLFSSVEAWLRSIPATKTSRPKRSNNHVDELPVEGRIKDKLADQGVRESDLELFLIEYRNGGFDVADVSRPEWIAEQKKAHAIRFIGGTDEERALYHRAFVEMNITAQGEVVRRFGNGPQALAAANEVAAR